MRIAVHRVDHIHNVPRLPSHDVSEVPTDNHIGAAGHGDYDVVRISRKRSRTTALTCLYSNRIQAEKRCPLSLKPTIVLTTLSLTWISTDNHSPKLGRLLRGSPGYMNPSN